VKLGPFIAGTFGIVGFALSVLAGLIADNAFESILIRAVICAVACYIIGYVVGLMAQQVSVEHAHRLSKQVADADAAEELKAAELAAAAENDAAGGPAMVSGKT
jgi:hypothetical protein